MLLIRIGLFLLSLFLWYIHPHTGERIYAGWGTQGCPPVGGYVVKYAAPVKHADGWFKDGNAYYSWWDGVVIAAYHRDSDTFRTYDAQKKVWGEPMSPPPAAAVPAHLRPEEAPPPKAGALPLGDVYGAETTTPIRSPDNFGVDRSKMSPKERCVVNGREVSLAAGLDAIGGDSTVPDDHKKPRLTVIGTKAECDKVLSDIATLPSLAALKDQVLVQDYRPDSWAVSRDGHVTTGHPTVYVQAAPKLAGGPSKVILRLDHWAPETFGDLAVEAIRKADPNYDPKKDPNGTSKPVKVPAPLVAGGGLLALLAFLKLKRG